MTITVEKLARAIERRLAVSPPQAADMAHRVLSYFGFENVIIDNAIDPEDRKLFYALHDAGLLRSSLENVILPSGKNWRIFYWELNESDLNRILAGEERTSERGLYKTLPDEAWTSHASTA